MATEKKVNKDFLKFGRYEGLWKNEKTGFECEVVIDENNFEPHKDIDKYPYAFDGFLEWRSTVVPKDLDDKRSKGLNKVALEKVRGFYFNHKPQKNQTDNDVNQDQKDQDNAETKMIMMGYEVYQSIHPDECGTRYSCDGYKFDLNPAYKTIDSFACNYGKWDAPISITRVASKDELIELLTEKFGNEKGIVRIVSDMLHHYVKPTIDLQGDNKESYKLRLRVLLHRQDKILKPLFDDIFDYEKEYDVKARYEFDGTGDGDVSMKVDDVLTIIQEETSYGGWGFALHETGECGWIPFHYADKIVNDDGGEQ